MAKIKLHFKDDYSFDLVENDAGKDRKGNQEYFTLDQLADGSVNHLSAFGGEVNITIHVPTCNDGNKVVIVMMGWTDGGADTTTEEVIVGESGLTEDTNGYVNGTDWIGLGHQCTDKINEWLAKFTED